MKRNALIFLVLTIASTAFGQQTIKTQIDYFGLINTLAEYKNEISESYHLTRSWVFIDKPADTPDKVKLKTFHQERINRLNESVKSYYYLLDSADFASVMKINKDVFELIEKQKYIMYALNKFEAYDDPLVVFDVMPTVEYGGAIGVLTDTILLEFQKLITKKSLEYIDLIGRQSITQSSTESVKAKKIKQLLDLLNTSAEIKDILSINSKSGLSRNFLEKDIYEILVQKYDKYYTLAEIEDLIAFYKTKTGKRMIKVSKKMMLETLTEILNKLKS